MHNIYATFVFSFFFFLPFTLNAQERNFSTEISPTSRMGNRQVLSNANSHFNLDWRNRMGMDIGNQFFLGVQANIRRYTNRENFEYSPSGSQDFTSVYDLKLSNTLWGVGPFLTKKFSLNQKLTLLTTLFASAEQGSGRFEVVWESFICPVCANNLSILFPAEIVQEKFRERNFLAGLEVGTSYKLTSRLSILGNINLIQYENFNRKASAASAQEELEPYLQRDIYGNGSGFTHFIKRPIIYLGVLLRL